LVHEKKIKIIDFGTSCFCEKGKCVKKNGGFCTYFYSAPEILTNEKTTFNNKIDIWSLGIIIYELFFGYPIFNKNYEKITIQQQLQKIYTSLENNLQNMRKIDFQIANIIKKCLVINPLSRESIENLNL